MPYSRVTWQNDLAILLFGTYLKGLKICIHTKNLNSNIRINIIHNSIQKVKEPKDLSLDEQRKCSSLYQCLIIIIPHDKLISHQYNEILSVQKK